MRQATAGPALRCGAQLLYCDARASAARYCLDSVTPARAGVQPTFAMQVYSYLEHHANSYGVWIPACAGMTNSAAATECSHAPIWCVRLNFVGGRSVMASEAKQSPLSALRLLRRYAPRNDIPGAWAAPTKSGPARFGGRRGVGLTIGRVSCILRGRAFGLHGALTWGVVKCGPAGDGKDRRR
jgi:hypothetical protein